MFMIVKKFEFEAAHFLPDYKGLCKNMHGHRFEMEIGIGFPPGEIFDISDDGMIMDFSILKSIVKQEIINPLDHQLINDKVTFRPTCENLILKFIKPKLHRGLKKYECELMMIRLWETSGSYAEWRID